MSVFPPPGFDFVSPPRREASVPPLAPASLSLSSVLPSSPTRQVTRSAQLVPPPPSRVEYCSDGKATPVPDPFPNFNVPPLLPPPFLVVPDHSNLPINTPLPVLSPHHNDSSFPLWHPQAPPPIPQVIGGRFHTLLDEPPASLPPPTSVLLRPTHVPSGGRCEGTSMKCPLADSPHTSTHEGEDRLALPPRPHNRKPL